MFRSMTPINDSDPSRPLEVGVMPGGDAVSLQAAAENLGYYVRVIPDWVATMKRAVDAANR